MGRPKLDELDRVVRVVVYLPPAASGALAVLAERERSTKPQVARDLILAGLGLDHRGRAVQSKEAQLLEGASPAARALVKGAFLEAAREHAPEWAPLIEADDG